MKEQYQRFLNVLNTDCDHCPIRRECENFSEHLSPSADLCEKYSCEMLLFRYVMNGKNLKLGVDKSTPI